MLRIGAKTFRPLLVFALCSAPSYGQVEALSVGTVGPSPIVMPPDSYALSVEGDVRLGGDVFKDGYPILHNVGGASAHNIALGLNALASADPSPNYPWGKHNTALGASALERTTSGYGNTAIGADVLLLNTAGSGNTGVGTRALMRADFPSAGNTAIGFEALSSFLSGYLNTAIGSRSLAANSTGFKNTAVGVDALRYNDTGKMNIAIGADAGRDNESGSWNIWIGSSGYDESNTVRIGAATGDSPGQQNRAFIAGIRNVSLNGDNEHLVCIDSAEQLGLCTESSARFKTDILDLEADSEALFALRPVRFRYQEEAMSEAAQGLVQFGLIAEEVAEVLPQLVTYDDEGEPLTVRYEALTPLLLNELRKLRERIVVLEADHGRLRALTQRVASLEELVIAGGNAASRPCVSSSSRD